MTPRKRIIVVGAGLFGSVIGRWAEHHGREVVWIDDLRPGAGSPPSAGLIKPSWLQGFGDAGHIGLEVLDKLVGLEDMRFTLRPTGAKVTVHHIPPSRVMVVDQSKLIPARVVKVGNGWVDYTPELMAQEGGTTHRLEGQVVVATGAWANELAPQIPRVDSLLGTAFFFQGQVENPLLEVWAPYKQIKVFNRPDNLIWSGDSSGLREASYTQERIQQSYDRCVKAVERCGIPNPMLHHKITGRRPVVPGYKQGFMQRVYPNTWVATGGGKMGTVLAGYMATRFLKEVGHGA